MREIKINKVYRHFKNKFYIVVDVAKHSETKEPMVVYRRLYDDGSLWVRPLDMFLSEVDHEKYPDVKQKYRFEEVDEFTDAMSQTSEVTKPLLHPVFNEGTNATHTVFLDEEVILSLAFVLFKTKCLQAYAIRKFNQELMKAVPYVSCVFRSDCMKRLDAEYPGFFGINNCGMYETHVELPVLSQRVLAYIPNDIIQAADAIIDKMRKHPVNEDMFDAP